MDFRHILGLSVGIVHNDKIIYSNAFGYKDITTKEPVKTDTTFQICSISKIFTGLLVMEQFERGKFKLDDDINQYLPHDRVGYIGSKNPKHSRVTFKHLLTHTSGIGELKTYSDLFHIKTTFDFTQPPRFPIVPLEGIFKKGVPCHVEPGTKYSYSNHGITLLGYLMEQFTGLQYHELVLEHILKPLHMDKSDAIFSNRVAPYYAEGHTFNGKKYSKKRHFWSWGRPAGGIYSCTDDMVKFIKFLLHKCQTEDLKLIQPETFDLMLENHNCLDPRLENFGLIFHLFKLKGFKIAWHGGHTLGFNCIIAIDVENQLGIIILGNTSNKRPAYLVMRDLLWKIYGINKEEEIAKIIQYDKDLDINLARKFIGVYGKLPGYLTNTRDFLDFGEFIIKIKDNKLWLKSLWGSKKNGVRLYPLDEKDPYIFGMTEQLGPYTMIPIEPLLFIPNPKGEIMKLYFELSELVKKEGIKSLKTKILLLKLITFVTISFMIGLILMALI